MKSIESVGILRIVKGKIFMKKHFGYTALILALYLSALSLKAEDIGNSVISQYIYKYQALEKFNQENERVGRPDLNRYLIELDPNWIEEKPEKVYTKSYYEELSKKLTDFNARREDKLKVYVMVVNNFYGQLKENIKLDEIKQGRIRFRDYVDVSHDYYKKFLSDIHDLPKAMSEAMLEKGHENRIIYFCGIIHLYKTPEKLKSYLYTNLMAEGPKLDRRRYDLAERMNLNWEVADEETIPENLELISDKIYKGVHNLMAAVEMVIDKGLTNKERDPRCEMASLEGVVDFTKTIREISYSGKATMCATLIKSPTDKQKLRSRYVLVENPGDFKSETFFHEELPDKVQLFSEKGYSNYKLYVAYKEIDFAMVPADWVKFAKDVYSRAGLAGNDILITVPYYKTSCTFLNGYGGETTQKDKLLMPGAYCASNSNIAAEMNAAFPSLALQTSREYVEKRWKEVFYQAFSKIPKYYELYFFSILWNGDVVFHEKKKQGPVTGLTDIVAIYLKIDARYDKYAKALGNRAICMPKLEDILLLNWSVCTDKFNQEVRTIFNSPEDYRVFDQKTNLMQGKLNEKLAKSYVEWISTRKVEGVFSAFGAPGGGNFYGGVNPVKVKDILTMIDAASFAASFVQLDFIFDAAGAYYAFSNDMTAEGALYTASLALPVSAGVLKTIEKGEKYLLKATKGQLIEVPAHLAKAIVRGEKVANQVGDITKSIINDSKSLERVLHYKDNPKFIQSLEEDLLKADESTIKTLNENPGLIDEFQAFHTEGKGDLKAFMEVKSLSPTDEIIHVDFDDLPGMNVASLGKDEAIISSVARIKSEEGWFDVIVHGSADHFWVLRNGKWEGITHRSLVKYLEKNPDFVKAQGVRLISCEAGTKALAQNFANKAGKKVRAVSGVKVGVDRSGKVVSTSGKPGHWAEFDQGNWTISFENPNNLPANNEIKMASEGDDVIALSMFDDLSENVVELKAIGIGQDPAVVNAVKAIKKEDGWQDVIVHGSRHDDKFHVFNGTEFIEMDARQLKEHLIANGYKEGTPIRLISCWSGSTDYGSAQLLAKELNVELKAPTNVIGVKPNGDLIIKDGGSWKRIIPNDPTGFKVLSEHFEDLGKIYNDLEAGTLQRKFRDVLSTKEEAVLRHFTMNDKIPGKVNAYLEGRVAAEFSGYQDYKKILNDALKNLPASPKNGVSQFNSLDNLNPLQLVDQYPLNAVVNKKGFTLTNTYDNILAEANGAMYNNVIFKITGKNGKTIEGNIELFAAGTNFKVTGKTQIAHPKYPGNTEAKITVIELVEQ